MYKRQEDNIWIGAGNTIYRCNSTASIVKEYDIFGSQQNRHAMNFVYQDREGNRWALTGGGVFRYDEKADSFVTYPPLGKNNAPYTCLLYTSSPSSRESVSAGKGRNRRRSETARSRPTPVSYTHLMYR